MKESRGRNDSFTVHALFNYYDSDKDAIVFDSYIVGEMDIILTDVPEY